MVAITGTPITAPRLLKNWRAALAVPSMRYGKALCTTTDRVGNTAPTPAPVTTIPGTDSTNDEFADSRESKNMPTQPMPIPITVCTL